MLKEKSVLFKNAKICYFDEGLKKSKNVVLLHGFLENKNMWIQTIESLKTKYRVIAIDLPGFGGSECLGYVHTMELMAQCVKSLLDQINVKKYLMVGHSMGGYVSLAFGEKHADALKGLCLFHSTCTADTDQKKSDRNRAMELVKMNKKLFVNQLINGLFEEKNKILFKKEIQKLVKEAGELSVQGINAALAGMRDRLDREIVIRFAPFPVYFLAGENDPVFDMNVIRQQTEIPRRKMSVFIPHCGHMAFIEQKAKYMESLKLFAQDAFK